jgi:hypothetical protein
MADCASAIRPTRRMICSDIPASRRGSRHAGLARIANPLSGAPASAGGNANALPC